MKANNDERLVICVYLSAVLTKSAKKPWITYSLHL
jgi:hypothetical protein